MPLDPALAAVDSEAGRCRRGRPLFRGGGLTVAVSSGAGCVFEAGTGEEAVGLPWLLGVGRGEGSEEKVELNSVAM